MKNSKTLSAKSKISFGESLIVNKIQNIVEVLVVGICVKVSNLKTGFRPMKVLLL